MRPRGEVALALLQAAQAGPGSVVQLAARGQVGLAVARYTCSRLVARGELEVITPGRPAMLGPARGSAPPPPCSSAGQWLQELQHRFVQGCQRKGPTRAEQRSQRFATL